MNDSAAWFGCPLAASNENDCVTLGHGEGGRLSRRLIHDHILPRLGNRVLHGLEDSAVLHLPATLTGNPAEGASASISFTTDGYTVTPLFFPGGDIGRLAVYGTVNDLAVSGALPQWLSLGMIIEEGLPFRLLDQVLDSVRDAARTAAVEVVAGDTKVVPRGAVDQLYITTSGIGVRTTCPPPGAAFVQPGDGIIVSGPIGCHGAAILCCREEFDFDPPPQSDCAPLTAPLMSLISNGLTPHAVRDATRGGVAAVLHEWMESSHVSCTLIEQTIPVTDQVRAVCELLGLETLHLANEGTFVLATPADKVHATLELLHRFDVARGATLVGRVQSVRNTPVSIVRVTGREVAINEPMGAPLPRIC